MRKNSMRRFFARPALVLLEAMGRLAPKPVAMRRFPSIPCRSRKARTERARVQSSLGDRLRAKLARSPEGELVGCAHYAELAEAGVPIEASGKWLYLYYAWVTRERRGAGIGTALIDAVVAALVP